MFPLRNAIRGYQWGSREFIARIQGRRFPTDAPEAELWIGAHPDSPSTLSFVDGDRPLNDVIAAAPSMLLGDDAVARFGPRLPYLMKLLAAQEPLSLQAHPDSAQAREAFASGHPSYVDPYHKPELILALEDFEALCGFAAPGASAALLRPIDELAAVAELLEHGDLRAAVTTLLEWPLPQRAAVVEAAAEQYELAARLAGYYPGDMGVVVALLLNHLVLRPGRAVWMPSGTLHAYIHGAGVEVMASSDNVLRGGLTRKPINVPELLRVLRFEPLSPPLLSAVEVAPGVDTWTVPVPDFRLSRIRLTPAVASTKIEPQGPRTVLCLSGRITVTDADSAVTLDGGEAAFGSASAGPLTFTGAGEAYCTSL
jgi:mannose-6-phosphate isomerase